MEREDNLTILTILSYYTEGFEVALISHVVSILNQERNFKSDFKYSFKVENQRIEVFYEKDNCCLSIIMNNGIDTLAIKRFKSYTEYIRTTNDGTFKATLDTINGQAVIKTEEITDSVKLELK